jgi:hypothetical protein
MSSISETEYNLYARRDGGIGITPSNKEVTLIGKGEFVYARKKELVFAEKTTKRIEISCSDSLVSTIQEIEDLLRGIFIVKFLEEGQVEPELYSNLRPFNGVNWMNLKVTDETKIFEKTTKGLKKSSFEEMPADCDIFPTVIVSNAWTMDIKGEAKFGVSIKIAQLFFRKNGNKKPKIDSSSLSLDDYF